MPPLPPPRRALWLTPQLRRELLAHAEAEAPRECVGVLGGQVLGSQALGSQALGSQALGSQALGGQAARRGWKAQIYVPLPNVAADPLTRYEADGRALIAALRGMRGQGLELVGTAHSHPRGPSMPSPTDVQQAGYSVPYLIADLSSGHLRAFLLPECEEVALSDEPAY